MMTSTPKRNLSYWLLAALVVMIPTLMLLFILRFVVGASLTEYIPFHNDPIFYWHQTLTFSQVGFNGGYYTVSELSAASGSRFYFHGPLFPMIYGTIGRVFGWYPYSSVIIDLVVITAALAFFILAAKPTRPQLIFFGLIVATAWTLNTYLISNMQEVLHHAVALVMAVIFIRALKADGQVKRGEVIAVVIFVLFVAQLRPTWSIMTLPYFLLIFGKSRRGVLASFVASGVLVLASLALFSYNSAPYPSNFSFQLLDMLRKSPLDALNMLLENLGKNIRGFGGGNHLNIFLRYELLALLLILLIVWFFNWRGTSRRLPSILRGFKQRELQTHIIVLGVMFLFQMFIYEVSGNKDTRAQSPFLLFSFVLLIMFMRFRLLFLFFLINLLLLPFFVVLYQVDWGIQFQYNRELIADFAEDTRGLIVYDPNAPSGWCNTVLMRMYREGEDDRVYVLHPELMMTAEAGIGVSFFLSPEINRYPLKSKYLLLKPSDLAELGDRVHVELLAETAIGNLYRNLDADCP